MTILTLSVCAAPRLWIRASFAPLNMNRASHGLFNTSRISLYSLIDLVWRPVNSIVCLFKHGFPNAVDLFQNTVRVSRPTIRLGVKIMMIKEAENVCDQGAGAAEGARANHLGRNFPKEAFDQVEPGRGGWGKMQMKAPMTFKPGDVQKLESI